MNLASRYLTWAVICSAISVGVCSDLAAQSEPKELKVPAIIESTAVGGSGRYLILAMPSVRQVAVFDARESKIVKYLPVDDSDVKVAAGSRALYVVAGNKKIVTRYSLATFERELTTTVDLSGPIAAITMGSASEGPLLICKKGGKTHHNQDKGVLLLDGKSHEPIKVSWKNVDYGTTEWGDHLFATASADGMLFLLAQHRAAVVRFRGNAMEPLTEVPISGRYVTGFMTFLDPRGRFVYAPQGIFTPEMTPLVHKQQSFPDVLRIPDVGGLFYLSVALPAAGLGMAKRQEFKATVSLHVAGHEEPLVALPNIDPFVGSELPKHPANVPQMNRALFLFPSAGSLVQIPFARDKLILHSFDLQKILDDSGTDYLFFQSAPASTAKPGSEYVYDADVMSNAGDVALTLLSAPSGMIVAGSKLRWPVPNDFDYSHAQVILQVADGSQQQVLQTFRIETGGSGGQAPNAASEISAEASAEASALSFADLPEITPTPFGEKTELRIPLPSTIDDLCVGGGGRFILLYFKSLAQIAVFDVSAGKIAGYLAAPGSDLKFAAGANRLVTVSSDLGVISRWNLVTRKRELTKPIALKGTVSHVLLGHASAGPALVSFGSERHSSEVVSVDLAQLNQTAIKFSQQARRSLSLQAKAKISANGDTIGVWELGSSPSGLQTYIRQGDSFEGFYEHNSVGAIIPSADGRIVFTSSGLFTSQTSKINTDRGFLYSPATHGEFYLRLELPTSFPSRRTATKRVGVTLHKLGDDRSIIRLPISPEFDDKDRFGQARLTIEQRLVFVPRAGAIVMVPKARDHLIVRRFDLASALDSTGLDYFFVTSEPKRSVELGANYSYDVKYKSKLGKVKLELASGPEGMKIDEAGTLTWKVPDNFNQAEATVIVGLRDGSGQELLHTFAVSISGVAERLKKEREEEQRRREEQARLAKIAEMKRVEAAREMQAKAIKETRLRREKWLADYTDAVARDDAAKPQIAGPVTYPLRNWTDEFGERIEARFVAVFAGNVILQLRDGAQLGVPGVNLSAQDRAYATDQFRQNVERRNAAERWKHDRIARQGKAGARAALKDASVENLARIQQALDQYSKSKGSLPPLGNIDAQTRMPLLSWRVHLLPYLGERELFGEFRLDEPWSSEHNLALLPRIPAVFQTPGGVEVAWRTHYVRIGAPSGFNRISPRDLRPDLRSTQPDIAGQPIEQPLVLEVGDPLAVTWTRPDDFDPTDKTAPARMAHLFGLRDFGCLMITTAGKVRRAPDTTNLGSFLERLKGNPSEEFSVVDP